MASSEDPLNRLIDALYRLQKPELQGKIEPEYVDCIAGKVPGCLPYMIQIIEKENLPLGSRILASISIKNSARDLFTKTPLGHKETKEFSKRALLQLLSKDLPTPILNNIKSAVSWIAQSEYPNNWPDLLYTISSGLQANSPVMTQRYLQVAHEGIFERYRSSLKSNELYMEIRNVLDTFGHRYIELFKEITDALEVPCENKILISYLECIKVLLEIYIDLISQDLPDIFQDSISFFSIVFIRYLGHNNEILKSDSELKDIFVEIKLLIVKILDMYAKLYFDEFPDIFSSVEVVCNILSLVEDADDLASKCLEFLRILIETRRSSQYFRDNNTIPIICENAIIPSIKYREYNDDLSPVKLAMSLFDDSQKHSRRYGAELLIMALNVDHAKEVVPILYAHVNKWLMEYAENPEENWESKNNAICLFTALVIKTRNYYEGASSINEFILLSEFFANHIIKDISLDVNEAVFSQSALFIYLLASKFTTNELTYILGLLLKMLETENAFIYTSAAICINKILSLTALDKIGGPLESFDKDTCRKTIARIFELIIPKNNQDPLLISENVHLVCCITKFIALLKEDITYVAFDIIESSLRVVSIISNNPSDPTFNYYIFEVIAMSIRGSCIKSKDGMNRLERSLLSQLFLIIEKEIVELIPYVLQIFAQVVGISIENGSTQITQHLFDISFLPALWANKANIQGLVLMVDKFLEKDKSIAFDKKFESVLGIFQKLVESKTLDNHGFDLLESIFEHVDNGVLNQYAKSLVIILLTRLTQNKTPKYQRLFVKFVFSTILMEKDNFKVDDFIQYFIDIQGLNLFADLIDMIIIPELKMPLSPQSRCAYIQAILKLITQSHMMREPPCKDKWESLISCLMTMCNIPAAQRIIRDDDNVENSAEYNVAFSSLKSIEKPKRRRPPAINPIEVKEYTIKALADFNSTSGGVLQSLAPISLSGALA